jgi:hypothetical protein
MKKLDEDALRAEIDRLTESCRQSRSVKSEQQLIRLRHELGLRIVDARAGSEARFADPEGAAPPLSDEVPEIAAADLTPELVRAGILRDGCVLVRGLVPREATQALAEGINNAFAEREKILAGGQADPGYYFEFDPDERFPRPGMMRAWIREGGGVLAADSPRLAFEMFELFEQAGIRDLVEGYLGEPALLSFEKTTLRKADPAVPGGWHQDGHFMGKVRALNLWLSLSRCGDESPGLDMVPRRLDELVIAGVDGAALDYVVTNERAVAVAEPKRVIRPIFEPGDALLFDELFLHKTGSDPAQPKPRFAVESWFFGASGFPEYAPLAV